MLLLKWAKGVPTTERSTTFLQGMLDRMALSFFKYGSVAAAYPTRVDAVASMQLRIEKYQQTGNTEFLMDAANFCMIEFMRPRHHQAHYRPTDSKDSPGRKWVGEVDPTALPNDISKHER